MSLIRQGDLAARDVRRLGDLSGPAAPPPEPDPELIALRAELVRLGAAAETAATRASDREAEVEAQMRAALIEAAEAGRREGRAEAEGGLALLEAALRAVSEEVARTLQGLEPLAARLAEEALAQVLDNPQDYRELVAGALRRQMAALSTQMVLAVEVSGLDFLMAEDLDALRAALGVSSLDLRAAPTLPRGACRLQLQLGGVELDLDGQWARLKAVLGEIFDGGAAA